MAAHMKDLYQKLAELNRARADLHLAERMKSLEDQNIFFYDKIQELTKRIEVLERKTKQ